MKVLFICNQNQNRSVTAEGLFSDRFETKSAGLYNQNPVTKDELEWADVVMVMEEDQRSEIAKRFPRQYLQKRILNLEIHDVYYFNSPDLIRVLEARMKAMLQIV